ncbi:MAG: hypothetical protein WD638_01060 [Nitriliruptoraceae bacterium]
MSVRPLGGGSDRSASDRREERLGWLLIALVTLGVLVTWAPSTTAALGDNHEGRILARHALNVANAQEDGLAASGWLSDWSPYVGGDGEQTSYAHHPPLLNLGYYLAGRLLPVDLDVAMRLFSLLLGAAMLPLGAAVLRRRGVGWPATVVATIAVAVTPLFWVYGRLSGNVTLLLAMTLLIVRVAEDRRIARGELATAAVVSVMAIVAGYLGMAMAALLGLWLLRRRGFDHVTITVGIAMVVGAAISLGYVIGSTGAARIGEQVQMRTTGGGFTAAEFLDRIATWARALLPWWWRWLLLPTALVAGVWDRRTRPLTIIGAVVTVGYVVGLPNGSFIHDYWILPVLLPVWFGTAALATSITRARPERERLIAGGVAAVLLVAGAAHGLGERVPGTYVTGPATAGELVRTNGPAAGQEQAWHTSGLPAPRWLSLYWDLPPAEVTEDSASAIPADDLVVVNLERTPGWLGEPAAVREVAAEAEGDYVLLRGETLHRLAADG